jgi:hypothetical protein
MVNSRYEQHRIAFSKGELPPSTQPSNEEAREAQQARQEQRRAESQKRREDALKARQEIRTARQPIGKSTPETYPCSLRCEVAGEVDCGCSGKPTAYVCNHQPTDNWTPENKIPNRRIPGCGFCTINVVSVRHKRIIKSDGTDIPLTHLSLPACSLCSERAKYSETVEVKTVVQVLTGSVPETAAWEVQPFVPFPEADQTTIKTRKAICSVCQIQAECPIYQSKALTMQLTLCPSGFWTTRANSTLESQSAQTVRGFLPVNSRSESMTQTKNALSTYGGEKYPSRNRLGWLNVESDVDTAEIEA